MSNIYKNKYLKYKKKYIHLTKVLKGGSSDTVTKILSFSEILDTLKAQKYNVENELIPAYCNNTHLYFTHPMIQYKHLKKISPYHNMEIQIYNLRDELQKLINKLSKIDINSVNNDPRYLIKCVRSLNINNPYWGLKSDQNLLDTFDIRINHYVKQYRAYVTRIKREYNKWLDDTPLEQNNELNALNNILTTKLNRYGTWYSELTVLDSEWGDTDGYNIIVPCIQTLKRIQHEVREEQKEQKEVEELQKQIQLDDDNSKFKLGMIIYELADKIDTWYKSFKENDKILEDTFLKLLSYYKNDKKKDSSRHADKTDGSSRYTDKTTTNNKPSRLQQVKKFFDRITRSATGSATGSDTESDTRSLGRQEKFSSL